MELEQRVSNYIVILDSTPGFNGSGRENWKTGRETIKFSDFIHLVIEVWLYWLIDSFIIVKSIDITQYIHIKQ